MKKIVVAILSVLSIVCVMPSIFIEASALTVNEDLTILEAETIAKNIVASKTINKSNYLYNFADEPKYIYVEFKEGGYAIFTSDTLDMLECSTSDILPFNDAGEKQYYGGPLSYFKKQNDMYINLLDEDNSFKNAPEYDESAIISAKSPGSSGATYISNAEYFYNKRPTYGTNIHGTCGSVAAQLLLSYNNYYNDRRIIAPEYLNGIWKKENNNGDIFNSSNYTIPSENPNVCYNPTDLNSKTGGTNGDFYRHIISYIDPGALVCVCTEVTVNETTGIATVKVTQNYADGTKNTTVSSRYAEPGEKNNTTHTHTGSSMDKVKEGIINILEEADLGSVYEVYGYKSAFGLTPVSSTPIKNEINEDRPLIITMGERLGGLDHWAIAYGYQDYTYNLGTGNEETYSGYVIHPGWDEDLSAMWVNEAWCDGYITLKLNHQHNYQVDTGNDVEVGRELRCLECGHRTLDELYNVNTETHSIVSCNYELSPYITIPSIINGTIINKIESSAFENQTQLASITLPSTITVVGDGAFLGCTNLVEVNLGYTATIGERAFQGCTKLQYLTNINDIVSIGELAFLNCNALQSIAIPNKTTNIGAGAFAGCNNLSISSYSFNYTAIANILYNANTTKVITSGNVSSEVGLPDTVTDIGEYAFYNNSNVETVIINEYVNIWNYSFVNCNNLEEIKFYSIDVPFVAPEAFNDFNFTVSAPNGELSEFEEVFIDCLNLQAIEFQIEVVCSMTGDRLGYASAYYREQVVLDFVPTKEDYEFWGLFEKPNGDGKIYVLKSDFLNSYTHQIQCESTNQIWTEKGAGTLYVHWEKLDKYVSYDVVYINESTQSPRSVFIRSGEQTTITAPTIDGYTFDHWTINSTSYTTASPLITVTLHRSYSTGEITIQNPDYPIQDAYFAVYYNKVQSSGGGSCVAQGTLVTLADGSQVPVESLTGNERLLVWNLKTGRFDTAPILFIDSEPAKVYEIINLYFSDGTHVKVIDEHAFWDFNLNKYVYLRSDASNYIGHYFNKQVVDENGVMTWTSVQLVNVTITDEYTTAWSPVTYEHLCLYVNGMLSMPGGIEGLVNTYEVDATTMKIDQALYLQDVETYGLFTYEEFYELYQVPREMFDAVDGANLKVAIGKGYIGYQTIAQLIERYAVFFE